MDTNDPAAMLLKVRDRYGFETPIHLMEDTTITQGEETLTPAALHSGTAVEVEYNFDINTAKRHAVAIRIPVSESPGSESPVVPEVSESQLPSPEEPAFLSETVSEPVGAEAVLSEIAPEAEAVE